MGSSLIYRINMSALSIVREQPVEDELTLGGRAFIVHRLLKEINPQCEPLGRHNKLLVLPGLLGGTNVPCGGRLSCGGKSPLTGGIKEANAGGTAGHALGRLGVKSLIFEEVPEDPNALYYLLMSKDKSELVPCPELRMLGTYPTSEKLFAKYGKKVSIIVIGPAGELRLTAAGITNTDRDGIPSRYSARGGLGALMASKGIKAIVLDYEGLGVCESADPAGMKELIREFHKYVRENPRTSELMPKFGSASMLNVTQAIGGLPTRGFTRGKFDQSAKITPEALRDFIIARGGNPTHSCMPGCPVSCSNVLLRKDGSELVSPMEYENMCLLGSNLDIGNFDHIGELNLACNDMGLDTIDTGAALGVAMEVGLIKFGDWKTALKIIRGVEKGDVLSRVIGCGAVTTGRVLGSKRVPAVKGQAMAAYEPRAIKGTGTTFATSAMGADHTAGMSLSNPLVVEGKVKESREAQMGSPIMDSLGICAFIGAALMTRLDLRSDLVAKHTGVEFTLKDLQKMAYDTLAKEREFNRRAGFTDADNRMPEWLREEPNPDTGSVYDVPDSEIDAMWS